ncbi:MAG: DUF2357 domain-containing protein [Dehalococcoidia bacterium]
MTDLRLLVVEVPGQIRVSIRGPGQHPHVGVVGLWSGERPKLEVSVQNGPDPVITWTSPDGTLYSTDSDGGPLLFEETRYRLTVEDLTGRAHPRVAQRDPTILTEIDLHDGGRLVTASLNFGRQIGRAELILAGGGSSIRIGLEVFPTKLDYESDYRQLLHEVSGAARGLALEYLRATLMTGGLDRSEIQTSLEWAILLGRQIDDLERALNFIAAHPHRSLEQAPAQLRTQRARRADPATRRAISRGLGSGDPFEVTGIGKVRPLVPARVTQETLDTPEHRWLRQQIAQLALRVEELHAYLVSAAREVPGRPQSDRTRAERQELAGFAVRLNRLLRLPPLLAATNPPPRTFSSLAIIAATGYRDAYQALMVLRLALSIDGSDIDFSVKDVHRLYETWCFLALAAEVALLLNHAQLESDLIKTSRQGLRIALSAGAASEIKFEQDGRTVRVRYNPSYPGPTGQQQPDIVLQFDRPTWPPIVVVFDAKYRLNSDPAYIATFGTAGPPIDAVNALHRYRDAIVVHGSTERGRPTVKGVALFPLPSRLNAEFETGKLFGALDSLGIGALPFTPTNRHLVSAWLAKLMEIPTDELAIPGPPFLGLERARTRAT